MIDNETTFDDLCFIRPTPIDEVRNWVWPKHDTGAWDGPSREWDETHKNAYMKYVKQKNVVFCAGGNCGLYTRLFAKEFRTVYSFEPDPLNFHCLVNNNQLHNVIKLQAALSNSHKSISLNPGPSDNVGMHSVSDTPGFIPTLKIDDFNPDSLDLIQLDVEGHEYSVILGALNNIQKFKPVISCERGTDSIFNILKSFGYVIAEQVGADIIYRPT